MLENKRIVITGGAGFIGSNIARSLCEENEVIVIDNLLTGRYENISDIADRITFVRDDVNNLDMLMSRLQSVDYVLHQAALPSVQRSVEDPVTSNMNNIDGTLKVLVAALDWRKEGGVRFFILSLRRYPILPKQEDMKPHPKSPYAVTKLAGEYYSRVFSEVYGLKTVCLRYFNVFGPRQNPNSQYAAVIPLFITRTLNRKSPIIFGDGLQTRDFTFVKDVVQANVLAMESPAEGVFNIACGHQITLNDLADRIMEIIGIEVKKVYDLPRKGDVRDSLADITYAREMLGYEPRFDLNSGLKETIAWFQKN